MRKYEKQILEYQAFVQEKCVREEAQEETIQVCQNIVKKFTKQSMLRADKAELYSEYENQSCNERKIEQLLNPEEQLYQERQTLVSKQEPPERIYTEQIMEKQDPRWTQEQIFQEKNSRASYFEFLYEQSKFIKKRWWLLQACVLAFLWLWLSDYATDFTDTVRLMGIFATVFVILIVPEIWKNRRNGAIEIEQASYYTLRQICAARMLMFAAVDFVIVMIFLTATYRTAVISLYDLIINFLLPVNVSCCICFRLLYSKWSESEYLAVFFCLVWVGVWTMIVANEDIYRRVAAPVWGVMLALTFAYGVFCVRKSLMFDEKILEGYENEVRV